MPLLTDYPQLLLVQELARRRNIAVYLVGGFIRDFFTGHPGLDFDFAVRPDAVGFARQFSRRVRGAFVLLDDEHGCARVVCRRPDGRMETFDFSDFRAASFLGDVRKRDFTVNTLACRVDTLRREDELPDVLLDHLGGKKDLRARRIRMVSPQAFRQDPLRLLRAFSLQAELGFQIESKTRAQIRRDYGLIQEAAYERIREELFKILATPRAAATILQMDRMGILAKIIPQITVMYRVRQGAYHHLDVWGHTVMTLSEFEKVTDEFLQDEDVHAYLSEPLAGEHSRLALIKLAIILHDIGKPQTLRKTEGKLSFHGHERVGDEAANYIARMLKLSTRERFALRTMVLWHLRPGYLSNFRRPSDRAVFRFFRDAKEEAAGIALLSIADQRATRGPMTLKKDVHHHEKICRKLIAEFFARRKAKPFIRLINGDDLIRKLKLKPSPVFAIILKEVEELQATGKIADRQAALELARTIAQREARRANR